METCRVSKQSLKISASGNGSFETKSSPTSQKRLYISLSILVSSQRRYRSKDSIKRRS